MSLMNYLRSESTDPAYNLALEEFVFEEMPADRGYFILWQNDHAIIVGKHQNTAAEINASFVAEQGIRVIRRLSGGGAVYHDLGNINYTFIADARDGEKLNLQRFCLPLIDALAEIGVKAELSGRNDICIEDKKISGNAQYLKRGRIMHHGTILFDSDLSVLAAALAASPDKYESKGKKSLRSRVGNVKEYLPNVMDVSSFMKILEYHMAEKAGMERYELSAEDERRIHGRKVARYDLWDWNYGASPRQKIHKERRFEGCGKIALYLDVDKGGRILDFVARGDYFGEGDTEELRRRLLGCKLERGELQHALEALSIDRFFAGLEKGQFLELMLL